MNEQLALKLFL